jgi:ribonucleoside-diphosphate reductase alpha chain
MLGSWNLVKYIVIRNGKRTFDFEAFKGDIPPVVEGMDNIFDDAVYPLPEQKAEQMAKRRMGIGVTGVANALEALGCPYGSEDFLEVFERILDTLRDEVYTASVNLAKDRGAFPAFDRDKYLQGGFIQTLPAEIRNMIFDHGIRNSHLLSIAPTGTISLTADNISSGIEPVFEYNYERMMYTPNGLETFQMQDYGLARFGVKGKTTDQCSVDDHLAVLGLASRKVDSACSKTINTGGHVTFGDFQDIYIKAWKAGAKGCTTFRKDGKRMGIMSSKPKAETQAAAQPVNEPIDNSCYVTESGQRICGD